MGVRTTLLAITPLTTETAAAEVVSQDVTGMLSTINGSLAVVIEQLTWLTNVMPSGSNKTALLAEITALT